MANPGQPTIRLGASGPTVTRAQRALNRSEPGERLLPDGIFGPKTDAAVRDFQKANQLPVDGIVGPTTWAALPNGGPMPLLKEGSTGEVVSRLQQILENGGFSPGPVDGNFGPRTRAAVEAFQSNAGLSPDGVVGDFTWQTSLHAAGQTLERAVGLQFVQD
ncbi:peptidoglycan-binding protein [Frankia sp. Cj3]|uniref:peptidoglycan-binding domain-containing protein n=1 Tax=Frankia sp. Cj3 TaxID=2880976 RepID=UPI001EF51010|nr:peptidoglycan-binding protein [Frankia sp. Cj3]